MNQRIKKIISIVILGVVLYVPTISKASVKIENEPMIVKANEEKCIVYMQELEKTKFEYAIFSDSNEQESDLEYFSSALDGDENQVAVIEKNNFDFENNKKAYLKIREDNQTNTIEIDFNKEISKSDIEKAQSTTKRINTEIVKDIVEEDDNDENGVHKILKLGGLQINEDESSKYYYDIKKVNDDEFKLMDQVKKINSEYENVDMYNKLVMIKDFNNLYEKLINSANWKDVENNLIKQPKDTTENTEYIIAIKKVEDGNEITDVKFLTSIEDINEAFKTEKTYSSEAVKLPITGENIILIIAFALAVISLIFVFIKLRKNNGKKENI